MRSSSFLTAVAPRYGHGRLSADLRILITTGSLLSRLLIPGAAVALLLLPLLREAFSCISPFTGGDRLTVERGLGSTGKRVL